MIPSELGGVKSLNGPISTTWSRFVEFITNGAPPWDMGVLDAHWIAMGPMEQIRDELAQSRRRREGLLTWVWPWRRQYLDGMIWALEAEMRRRERSPEVTLH